MESGSYIKNQLSYHPKNIDIFMDFTLKDLERPTRVEEEVSGHSGFMMPGLELPPVLRCTRTGF